MMMMVLMVVKTVREQINIVEQYRSQKLKRNVELGDGIEN